LFVWGREGLQTIQIRSYQIEDEVIAVPQPYDINSCQSALVLACDVGASRKSKSLPDDFITCPTNSGGKGCRFLSFWLFLAHFRGIAISHSRWERTSWVVGYKHNLMVRRKAHLPDKDFSAVAVGQRLTERGG
jgi:hypothetical protein